MQAQVAREARLGKVKDRASCKVHRFRNTNSHGANPEVCLLLVWDGMGKDPAVRSNRRPLTGSGLAWPSGEGSFIPSMGGGCLYGFVLRQGLSV